MAESVSNKSSKDEQRDAKERTPPENKPSSSPLSSRLPPWVTGTLRSSRALKTLFRCFLVSWLSFVILLPNASLRTLGTAAFFANLASFFLPPFLPVQMFIFLISTLVIGLLLGWGLGAAAMRAALASRNAGLLQDAVAKVQGIIASNPAYQANPTLALTAAAFEGLFLDIRSSAVFGCFLLIATFVFGLMRAYLPQLAFMSVFGTIGIDIFCTIGPLFPTPQYTILNSLIISVACYIAIAILGTIFIFPETMNHSSLNAISGQLQDIRMLLAMQEQVLKSAPEQLTKEGVMHKKTDGLRIKIFAAQQKWRATLSFISLEFSWGKWNSDDIVALSEPLLGLVARMGGLQTFAKLIGDSATRFPLLPQTETSSTTSVSTIFPDTYLIRQMHQRNIALETTHNVRITDILSVLESSTLELRKACEEGLGAVKDQVDHVNQNRYRGNNDTTDVMMTKEFSSKIDNLRRALDKFRQSDRFALLKPYEALISSASNEEDGAKGNLPLRSLYLSYVFSANLVSVVEGTLEVMEIVSSTVSKRVRNRVWAPKGLRKLGKLLRSKGDGKAEQSFGDDTGRVEEENEEEEGGNYRLDPDSKPPTNLIQRVMNTIHSLYKWSKTPEALFTFKYMIVSIALWIPSVVPSFANFYYVEKGLWALIMAQTTLNIYAADQIFNLIARLIGTFLGLCFGLAAWYIGNGHGTGNAYGAAASMALFLVPLVFVRVYAPPTILPGVLLCCATFTLIIGYSWVDGHLTQFASPGIGWSIAWKRFVLVVIGSGASFVMMMLPPTSGRKAVRLGNAKCINSLGRLYGFLVETWISSSSLSKGESGRPKWITAFRIKLISTAEQIASIRSLTELAKWEGSIRGAWPREKYVKMLEVEREMIGSLAQLGGSLGHMDEKWRGELLHSTRFVNPHFITDVMSIFELVAQSLRTAEPMHQVLPTTLLDRLLYHHHRSGKRSSEGGLSVSVEQIRSLDYMYYATGVVAVHQLLFSLDELQSIAKELCGEVPLKGFGTWKEEYDRLHV